MNMASLRDANDSAKVLTDAFKVLGTQANELSYQKTTMWNHVIRCFLIWSDISLFCNSVSSVVCNRDVRGYVYSLLSTVLTMAIVPY